MYNYIAALALAGGASARVVPRGQGNGCCFELKAAGGQSGSVGQLGDGQNRIGGGYSPATYCINDGAITDSSGRGCILTPPTTQFQCDEGATPTEGFSISGEGSVEYNGSTKFYACGADTDEYNIYTKPVDNQKDCVEITLSSSGGKCSGNGGSGGQASGSSAPAQSAASTKPAGGQSSAPSESSAAPSKPGEYSAQSSAPASSAAPSKPAGEQSGAPTPPAAGGSTAPAEEGSQMPSSPAAAPSQPAGYSMQSSAPASSAAPTAPAGGQSSAPMPPAAGESTAPAECGSQPPPAYESAPPAPSAPQETAPGQGGQPKPETSAESAMTSAPAAPSAPQGTAPAGQPSMPQGSAPAGQPSSPPQGTAPAGQPSSPPQGTAPAGQPSMSQGTASAGQPSSPPQGTAPAGQSSSPPQGTAPAGQPSSSGATTASGNKPSGTSSGSACQTSLSGAYQTPHLIVPISSEQPDQAFGTNYNGQINSTTSTIFNFDIPQDYEGKQCSIIFLFPKKEDLETSSYEFGGKGSLSCSELGDAASEKTSYSNAPKTDKDLGTIDLQPGNSYVVATQDCKAGQTQSIELSSENGLSLNFFEDWNPSPLGLYITSC